jgi:protein involved in sex pheromone biosynthesis
MNLETFKRFVNSVDNMFNDYEVVLRPNYNIKNPQTLEVNTTKDYKDNTKIIELRLIRGD